MTMRYLTNTKLENGPLVAQAAEMSRMNVGFLPHPMPRQPGDTLYDPRRLVDTHGCIYTHQSGEDHGPFWRAMEHLGAKY